MIYQSDNQSAAVRLNDNFAWLPDEDDNKNIGSENRKERKYKMKDVILVVLTILVIAMRIGLSVHNRKVMNGEDD